MDRYQEMQVFVAVADAQGFAPASRQLGLSAATVTRAVAALEQRLGVLLLVRTTRHVRLTESGTRFVEQARRILAEMEVAEESAAGLHARPQGMLTLSAPVLFGQNFLLEILLDYLDGQSEVTIRAIFADRFPSLHEEGIDVALLMGDLPDSSMIALHVGEIRRIVCAAPAYLAEHGRPERPADLARHRLVVSAADARIPDWKFETSADSSGLNLSPRLTVSTNQAAIEAASSGWGITRVMSYQVAPQLADGSLQTVLTEFEPTSLPVQLVYREGHRASAKVRSFVDFAAPLLRAHPGLH